ncbi:hypothetical protein PHAMO_250003 [Magnetospirillum molischianum DSM 120]|uniref:Transposase n=1 Tax=Magnetospirillum molischianum DSM 120 TaxID=1150626 RepID=H8FRY5_MAGML|nr:hypothetical protein PHAMO_250003 [Magnetospirillum molischianum DSM 120]
MPTQGLPPHRHQIRPTRQKLHGGGLHCRNRQLLVMSPDPNVRRTPQMNNAAEGRVSHVVDFYERRDGWGARILA